MPIYKVTQQGADKPRLVKADSSAQAIRHCAKEVFAAQLCSKVEDAADLLAEGVKLETAGEEPTAVAPAQQQEPPAEGDQAPTGKGRTGKDD